MDDHYPMILEWSEEERTYIVTFPDLPGCMADGPTPEEAVREAQIAKGLWLDVVREEGWPIPKPRAHILADA